LVGPKVAVTVNAEVRVKVQLVAPVHPDQLVKLPFAPGVSLSVTDVPGAKLAVQTDGQLIPPTLLVTVPVPVPAKLTVNTNGAVVPLKLAVTAVAAVIVRLQVGVVPEQAPAQLVKVAPVDGVAVRVTAVLGTKFAVHELDGQLIPPTLLVTFPEPVTDRVSASCPAAVKLAPTVCAADMVTVQAPVPVQLPLQPPNV
jgi:hypothetical protein